jgi:hypothetical protein
MQVLFWTVAAAIFALAASWMMLACALTGLVLRASHQLVIPTRWFTLVRRYGLWGALRRSLAAVARKGVRGLWPRCSRSLEPIAGALAVPISGFIAAAFLPGMVPILLLPSSFNSGELGRLLAKTALVAGAVGAVTATYLWLLGLGYVARPSIQRRMRLTRLSFPAGLSQTTRDRIALNIYWYSRISSATIFAAIYPWWFFIITLASTSSNSQSTSSGFSHTFPILLSALILLAAFSITMIPAMAVARPIELRMVSAKVCEELCLLLQPAEGADPEDKERFPGLIADPLRSRRRGLAQVAGHLADTARQLDARQKRGLPPHPISTLLRAVSHAIRKFLGNERSLQGIIPDDLTEMLGTTLALLGADDEQSVYHRLAHQISAFDEHGNPAVEVIERPPGRVAHLMSFTVTGIPKLALVITSIAGVAAISIAVALVFLHRMNVSELLHYLR